MRSQKLTHVLRIDKITRFNEEMHSDGIHVRSNYASFPLLESARFCSMMLNSAIIEVLHLSAGLATFFNVALFSH